MQCVSTKYKTLLTLSLTFVLSACGGGNNQILSPTPPQSIIPENCPQPHLVNNHLPLKQVGDTYTLQYATDDKKSYLTTNKKLVSTTATFEGTNNLIKVVRQEGGKLFSQKYTFPLNVNQKPRTEYYQPQRTPSGTKLVLFARVDAEGKITRNPALSKTATNTTQENYPTSGQATSTETYTQFGVPIRFVSTYTGVRPLKIGNRTYSACVYATSKTRHPNTPSKTEAHKTTWYFEKNTGVELEQNFTELPLGIDGSLWLQPQSTLNGQSIPFQSQ